MKNKNEEYEALKRKPSNNLKQASLYWEKTVLLRLSLNNF